MLLNSQRQVAGRLPLVGPGELLVAQHDAGELVGSLGMRSGQRHRHVHVAGAATRRSVEDRHHEPWVRGVEHPVDVVAGDAGGHGIGIAGVELIRGEATVAGPPRRRLGARGVDVGHDHRLEELPATSDHRRRRAHSPTAHHEYAHGFT